MGPYFVFMMTLSQKIVIFIKNQRFHFFTIMIVGWLQWLGRAKILNFRRIWVHVTKCLLWKNSLFGRFLAKSIFSIHFDLLDDIKSLCLLWKQKHLDFVLFFFGEIFLVWNGHIWVPKLRLVRSRLKDSMKMDGTRF